MSYRVLARKWRPQTWDDIVAQEHVTGTLKNAIEQGRLAHAYLFSGPRGVGKTSAARILAKALNCEHGPTVTPCNSCSACAEITEGRSVDVLEIDGASNNGVNEVRNLRENVRYTPARGTRKVYIIDEVHMLTVPAFNALLKTLEEPPDHILFIFATTEPQKIPATIVSRCQRFDFRRIPASEIAAALNEICVHEQISITDDALEIIAAKADGSLRDSQSILDQMASFQKETITAEDVIKGLGLIEQEVFFQLTDAVARRDAEAALSIIEKMVSGGYDVEEFTGGLVEHLRNILVVQASGSAELLETAEKNREKFKKAAESFSRPDLLRLLSLAGGAGNQVKRNPQPRIPLEMAVLAMIEMDTTVDLQELFSRIENMAGAATKGGTAERTASQPGALDVPRRQSPVPAGGKAPDLDPGGRVKENAPDPQQRETGADEDRKKKALDIDEVEKNWEEIITRIKHRKITVGSFLQEGRISGLHGNCIEIAFGMGNGFHIDAIMRAKIMVREIMTDVLDSNVTFRCVKKEIPKREIPSGTESKRRMLKELMEEKPVIRKIHEEFGTKIIE